MKNTQDNNMISIGSIVDIYDYEEQEKVTYSIVSDKSGTPNEILQDSVLGKSLLGKTIGEKVIVNATSPYEIEILSVDNSNVLNEEVPVNAYLCFQGKEWLNELSKGYIFALSDGIPHHERLRELKKGDIILHGGMQGILAISIVNGEYLWEDFPEEHFMSHIHKGKKGLLVKTNYTILKNPIITYKYIEDIKRLQGYHEGKGYPFNKNGKGNEGYLFNLNNELAKFFLNEIIKVNPFVIANQDIVKFLG